MVQKWNLENSIHILTLESSINLKLKLSKIKLNEIHIWHGIKILLTFGDFRDAPHPQHPWRAPYWKCNFFHHSWTLPRPSPQNLSPQNFNYNNWIFFLFDLWSKSYFWNVYHFLFIIISFHYQKKVPPSKELILVVNKLIWLNKRSQNKIYIFIIEAVEKLRVLIGISYQKN